MTDPEALLSGLYQVDAELAYQGYMPDGTMRSALREAIRIVSQPPKLCGTCKHWGTPDDSGMAFRACLGIPDDELGNTSECLDEFFQRTDSAHQAVRIAYREQHKAVMDALSFRTKASFSCNLHSPKEPT